MFRCLGVDVFKFKGWCGYSKTGWVVGECVSILMRILILLVRSQS